MQEEGRRFIRFVLPGAFGATEALFLAALLCPSQVADFVGFLGDQKGLAAPLGAIITMGIVGSAFSTIHHVLYWKKWPEKLKSLADKHYPRVDHTHVMSKLERGGVVMFIDPSKPREAFGGTVDWTRERAWEFLTSLWYELREKSERLKGAHEYTVALSDNVHMMGALRIASVAAPVSAITFATHNTVMALDLGSIAHAVTAFLVAVLVFCLFSASYDRTVKQAQNFIDHVFSDGLLELFSEKGNPIFTVYIR